MKFFTTAITLLAGASSWMPPASAFWMDQGEDCYSTSSWSSKNCKDGEFEIARIQGGGPWNSERCCKKKGDFENFFSDLLAHGKGDVPINRVLMLGSHNSGTYMRPYDPASIVGGLPTGFIDAFQECQKLDIVEQLNLGVRAFDMRFTCDDGGRARYFHGEEFLPGINAGNDALLDMWSMRFWLEDHPNEIVVLKVRQEKGSCTPYWDEVLPFPDMTYTMQDWDSNGRQWPTLEEMVFQNKRVVIAFDDQQSPSFGGVRPYFDSNQYDHTWTHTETDDPYAVMENCVRHIDGMSAEKYNHKLVDVNLYSTLGTDDVIEDKAIDFAENAINSFSKGILGDFGVVGDNPLNEATKSNTRFENPMRAITRARDRGVYVNIVMMDYVGYFSAEDPVREIFAYNKYLPGRPPTPSPTPQPTTKPTKQPTSAPSVPVPISACSEFNPIKEAPVAPEESSTCSSTRCGSTWKDANDKCGTVCATWPSPGWDNCPEGEECFADLSTSPCGGCR